MKLLRYLLLCLTLCATPVVVRTARADSASEQVMWWGGYYEALEDGDPGAGYRVKAYTCAVIASLFPDIPVFVAYCMGRSAAYHYLADLAGEP